MNPIHINTNRIGGVMVHVFASSTLYSGFEPRLVKPKTMKLVFVASPQARSINEKEQRLVGSESG